MKKLAQELWQSARLLVPAKYRYPLILLILVAAAIPVTELLVAKLFTDLVVNGAEKGLGEIIINLVIFGLLFVATRVANYIQKTYRVRFLIKLLEQTNARRLPRARAGSGLRSCAVWTTSKRSRRGFKASIS